MESTPSGGQNRKGMGSKGKGRGGEGNGAVQGKREVRL